MAKWDAIVLTCASRNSSIAYQKELELKQKKGLIDSESLIICIEDPEKPIGSGGATLNALLIVAEAFSTREKSRMTNIELLKDAYILIMHMGRQYSFDLVAKGLSTLPLLEKSTGYLLNNFDLLYNTMSYQVACFDNNKFGSDPGVYVCSTDMIFFLPKSERIFINNKPICVLASLAEAQVAKNNGIYELDETKTKVKNIYFRPDDTILNKLQSENNGLFNLVSGIVYFNYEVAEKFFSLIMYPPMDACSYIGVDSGAAPLCISVFFDILLSCCSGIELDEYLSGSFKTNHTVAQHNQLSILRQARATLWQAMHGLHHIDIIVAKGPLKHVYMDNETFDHRRGLFTDLNSFMSVQSIFKQFDEFEPHHHLVKCLNVSKKNASISASSDASIIINCHLEKSNLKLFKNSILVDCNIQSCNLAIGENSYLSDLNLNGLVRKIPSNVFIQGASLKLESLNVETILNIVFGVKDNVTRKFSPNEDWTIMNESWEKFSRRCGITASDLWPSVVAGVDRTLSNAKLYPIFNLDVVSKDEMANLSEHFWIDLIQSATTSTPVANVVKWRQSVRLSLEEVACYANLEKLLSRRRHLFNLASVQTLVEAIVRNRPIQFASLIRNAVHDGYAELMLNLLDEEALKNSHNLILLPRIMIFISNILYEMASSHYSVRSGPGLNANWLSAFACIEANNIEQALSELSKERRKWMNRPDLIIRAARHYEGSMLAFIRLATSCFKLDSSNRIQLTPISEEEKRRQFEWVIAESPARLDLAGAWSDTPPITYECAGGSCVTNVAIRVNGRKPIGAKCRKLETDGKRSIRIVMKDNDEDGEDAAAATQLVFTDLDELRDYNKPQAAACLMKACLVFTHVVDFGSEAGDLDEQLGKKIGASLEVHTWTGLPHGSGLGTSSILIGCVLKALWRLMGVQVSNESLSYSILVVEQIMTTNGGWQDQVGSIWGGFKTTTAKNQLPLEIDVRELKLDARFVDEINSRLILIYTGITRLAKDLLLNVLRNWYAISKEIYENVQELVKNGSRCARALENGDIKEFGECINRHRAQKLIMAPGSEPDSVKQLISILEPHVYGLAMAGAGGGGFVFALTRQPNSDVEQLKQLLESSTCTRNMKIYEAKICNEGISLNFS